MKPCRVEPPIRFPGPPHVSHEIVRAYDQRGVGPWMIGIANLNLIGIEFLQCLSLGGRAHPIESLQPRTHGRFNVGDELFDLDFGAGGKVLRSIKPTQAEAHITETVYAVACAISATDGADGPLPSHLLLRLAGKNLVAELE